MTREFGAYFAATALGINIAIVVLMGRSVVEAVQSLLVFYPIIAIAIGAGAWLEVRLLRNRMQDVSIPGSVNMEELRTKTLEMLKRQSAGRHDTRL